MKSNSYFHFKQFSVRHDRCAMKVGTDAVLLGAWVNVTNARTILDIGTGSGVIALMLAQRTTQSTIIESVEIEKDAADQAAENFLQSPWPSKLKVEHLAIQDYISADRFDLIVTNPPYFNKSLAAPDKRRHDVRHTSMLPYEELLSSVARLLSPEGRFNVILPYAEGKLFSEVALRYQLYCSRRYSFRSRREKPVERTLMEFTRTMRSLDEGEILLYDTELEWSADYQELTRDFYLKK